MNFVKTGSSSNNYGNRKCGYFYCYMPPWTPKNNVGYEMLITRKILLFD